MDRRKGRPVAKGRLLSRVIVNMGGRDSGRATAPRKCSARQEPRPPGLARWFQLPKSATAPRKASKQLSGRLSETAG